MKQIEYSFQHRSVQYYLDGSLQGLDQYADRERTILLVDEHVNQLHGAQLAGWKKIEIPSGEEHKDIRTFLQVIDALISLEADRKTLLVGIGGGVVTDLTGYVASVYMRGLPFAFVPATLLAQVDASVGGKNGINHGKYKNMLGIIRQPQFILFDYSLLSTLPREEWYNGFAEIIKYACILDPELFDYLERHKTEALSGDPEVIAFLVERSVALKSAVVQEDENEEGKRRWLNFGHTLGHAIEKLEGIAHGKAVAQGMAAAARFSERLNGLASGDAERIIRLISDYHLPVTVTTDKHSAYDLFRMDKKRERDFIHFVLLKGIGEATTKAIPLEKLKELLWAL